MSQSTSQPTPVFTNERGEVFYEGEEVVMRDPKAFDGDHVWTVDSADLIDGSVLLRRDAHDNGPFRRVRMDAIRKLPPRPEGDQGGVRSEIERIEASIDRWEKLNFDELDSEEYQIALKRLVELRDTLAKLYAQDEPPPIPQATADGDTNMLRLKACEHIAEGDEGWELLRNECPSTAAVASLRDALASSERRRAEVEALLRRISEWDHLDETCDGPMWRRAIKELLAAKPGGTT